MAGIFDGKVSWLPGVDDFKVNYVLEGDLAANVFESKIGDASYVFLGDINGREYITKARTFEWGINSIQPDGQIAAAGNMQLPIRWGLNGQLLGIAAGSVDWITPSDISNLSVSIAQLGCSAITNKDLSGQYAPPGGVTDDIATPLLENLKEHYRLFVYNEQENFAGSTTWSGIAGEEVRLSTSLGLFSHAKAISSMALGWQNITSLPYSTLIGSNLDLSGHPYYSQQTDFSFGEVVIGTSNKKFEMRPVGREQRILTIGCGDLSDNSGNDTRDDAMYILKDGSSYFTKDVEINGNIELLGDISFTGKIDSYNKAETNYFRSDVWFKNTQDDTTIKIHPSGTIFASNHITAQNKLSTKTIETNDNFLDVTAETAGENSVNFKNFTEVKFSANETFETQNTIIKPRGISSEDISCNRISIGGLHFPPLINTTRHPNHINQLGQEKINGEWSTNNQNSKFVLTSTGKGTVEWNDLSSVAIDVSLHQLADITVVNRGPNITDPSYLNIGSTLDICGIKIHNLWVSNVGDVSNAIIEGSIDICKNVLIDGHLEVSGNTDICGNVDICGSIVIGEDVDISKNVKIGGDVDISKNVLIDGHIDIKKNVKVEGHVDISKNIVIDGTADISGNVDISGDVQINGRVDISKNVTIAGDVDISGTTYLNNDVTIGKFSEPAFLGVTGNVDISGTVKTSNNIECSGNLFFSESARQAVQTLDFEDKRLSILGLIKSEVATAIGQSIKTPAGGIIWFARDEAPNNYRVCNGQFFNRVHSPDLYNNLSASIKYPWNNGFNGMSLNNWQDKYIKNRTIVLSFISGTIAAPTELDIDIQCSLTKKRNKGNIKLLANPENNNNNQDISYIFFRQEFDSTVEQELYIRYDEDIPNIDSIIQFEENGQFAITPTAVSQGLYKFTIPRTVRFDNSHKLIINLGNDKYHININIYDNPQNWNEFKLKYIQLPDLMDKFIRGSDGIDISIGAVKTEQLRDHKHISTDHQHDLQNITVDFSHNHDLSYNMHDMSINHHQHSIAMGYMNYSSKVISKNLESHVEINPLTSEAVSGSNTSDISLLIHPDSIITNNLKDGNVNSITSKDQGGGELIIARHTKKNEEILDSEGNTIQEDIRAIASDTNLIGNYKFISISNDEYGYDSGRHEFIFSDNTFTDASRSYVQNAYDVSNRLVDGNSTSDDISPEGYPTHQTLLPCISIGVVQGVEGEGDFDYDSYTYQTRIRYLENRLDRMDRQMNTTGINIIGGLEHIQTTVNGPAEWDVPTRGNIYESFNYTPYVFDNTHIGKSYYFDFRLTQFNASPANHHRVSVDGTLYDISGSPERPYAITDIDTVAYGTPQHDGVSFSDIYRIITATDKITIARYYPDKDFYPENDISWTFINPEK
tara:strand:+ start:3636 stop:7781 length:4146 start_codon:yes stop_codon:yes gene_type:complete